jgi:hypothetical protein
VKYAECNTLSVIRWSSVVQYQLQYQLPATTSCCTISITSYDFLLERSKRIKAEGKAKLAAKGGSAKKGSVGDDATLVRATLVLLVRVPMHQYCMPL